MIRVLEDRLVNQIAAGEVVERPASVVKELVENALDAGARHLRITLRSGGCDLVQVEDDGHGMDRHDAMLCVERHATSKIASSEDLGRIRTLGFRGEALPSIAAVSRFELITRRPEDAAGTRVVIEGGRMVDVRDAGSPPGTRITVRNLFYNLPARRKFLRTPSTELSHCQDAALREVLVRPGVGLDLFHDGRALVRAPAEADAAGRAGALLGREAEQLVPISFQDEAAGGLRASGLVSPPGVHRATSRGALWLYVNGRPVSDPLMRRAVLDAFRGLVPKGRFPTVILDLRLPVEEVDVNVHPAKAEVRFHDGRGVARALAEGLREGLSRQGIRPTALTPARGVARPAPRAPDEQVVLPGLAAVPPEPQPSARPPADPPPLAADEGAGEWTPPPVPPRAPPSAPRPPAPDPAAAERREPFPPAWPGPRPPEARPALPEGDDGRVRLVGQHDDRWLVCSLGDTLLLVDQHRAHAAAIARRLADDVRSRPLLAPVLVEADSRAVSAVDRSQVVLMELGVELDTFGGDTLRLRSLPDAVSPSDPRRLAVDLAQALAGGASAEALRDVLARAGAIPAGTRLSAYEQRRLLDEVDPLAPGVAVVLDGEDLARRLERGS